MAENIKSITGNSIGNMNGNMIVGDTNNNTYEIEKIEKVENRTDVNGNNNIVLQAVTCDNIHIEIQLSEELFRQNEKIISDTTEIKDGIKDILDKLNGKSALPQKLTLLPAVTEFFIGRNEALEELHNRLFTEQKRFILLVNGQGGIGKTTFAAAYCQKYEAEYKHIAWVVKETNIPDALLMLEMPLKLPVEGLSKEQRINQLLSKMQNLDKPCLMVIDNANDRNDIDKNLHLLKKCYNFHLLLTTRVTTYGNQNDKFEIDSLPFEKAKELFTEIFAQYHHTEDQTLQSIYDAVGGNTLIIEILAKNLREINKKHTNKYTLNHLLADIQSKGILSISHEKQVSTEHWTYTKLEKQNPTDVIQALFDITELSHHEKMLLRQIVLLPVVSISYADAEKMFENYTDFEKLFDELNNKGWLTFNENDKTFKFSPVIQQVSETQTPITAADAETLIDNLTELLDYEGTVGMTHMTVEQAAPFARYAESIFGRLRTTPNNSLSILSERIGSFYRIAGDFDKALQFFNDYSKLKKELYDANPKSEQLKNGLAISYSKLGDIYQELGDFDKALQFFNLDIELTKELYDANPKSVALFEGLAISYYKLAMVYKAKGDNENGMKNFKEVKRIVSILAENFPQIPKYKNWNKVEY